MPWIGMTPDGRVPLYYVDLNGASWDSAPGLAEDGWQDELESHPQLSPNRCAGAIVYNGLQMRMYPVVTRRARAPFEINGAIEWYSESPEYERAYNAFVDRMELMDS
ncbi:hypothetical protein AbraIFM66951_004624 [Aspergillus brasiliensis]|uniref:Uncharacterized protein n=1 Tax=Aspergillus brasiliensis TaxID=319629 RepID=A0A9W6DQW9_9EURO|nr:hypothetical protein AbraCBS73388_010373 [Aspergillus brasiliensis]GKZ50927.1 hypothetical protein AbraIFM66951_004624 [Aspergillus brasiliensis]